MFKELAERRESVFVEMCKASNSTPRELLAMPIKQLHELAELVTKQTIPDPQKIVACLKDYINGIETS